MDTKRYEDSLQRLANALIHIEVFLPHIVGLTRDLLDWRDTKHFKFSFDSETGTLVSVDETRRTPKLQGDMHYVLVEEFRSSCFQYCDIIHNELPQFVAAWSALDQELTKIPAEVHRELSGVRIGCRSWRAYVRKYVIAPLDHWPSGRRLIPRHPYEKMERQQGFPQQVCDFLVCFEHTDPSDHWDRVLHKIRAFVQDIRIAALELGSQVNTLADGPAAGRHWACQGHLSKNALTEKPFQLATRLWNSLGRRISIRMLTQAGELFEGIQEESVQKQGRAIGDFFLDEGFPIVVESGGGQISMMTRNNSN